MNARARRITWFPAVGATVAIAATFLLAQPLGAEVMMLTADPPSAPPGGSVTLSGGSCPAGVGVTFYLGGSEEPPVIGSTVAAADGTFSGTAVIPEGASLGLALVGAQCDDDSATMYIDFEIIEAPTTTTTTSTTVAPTSTTVPAPAPTAAAVAGVPAFTG